MSEFDSNSESPAVEAQNPTSLLDLAQKLHDDYVARGREEAERIVAEAQRSADDAKIEQDRLIGEAREFNVIAATEARNQALKIVETAETTSFAAIREAELKARAIVAEAEDAKAELEASILKLREFEEAYRHNLKALAEGALGTLGFTIADVTASEDEIELPNTESELPHIEDLTNEGEAYADPEIIADDSENAEGEVEASDEDIEATEAEMVEDSDNSETDDNEQGDHNDEADVEENATEGAAGDSDEENARQESDEK